VILPNFVAIGQTVVVVWQFMAIFQMAAVYVIWDLYEFEILSAGRVLPVSMRHRAKFHGDRSIHC